MKSLRTVTVSSRITEEELAAIKNICYSERDTPARIFRNLILDWISKHQKKVKNNR